MLPHAAGARDRRGAGAGGACCAGECPGEASPGPAGVTAVLERPPAADEEPAAGLRLLGTVNKKGKSRFKPGEALPVPLGRPRQKRRAAPGGAGQARAARLRNRAGPLRAVSRTGSSSTEPGRTHGMTWSRVAACPGAGANGGCAPNSRKWRLLSGGAREAALRADTWDVLWAGGGA